MYHNFLYAEMFWLGVVIDCNYTIKIVCMVWHGRVCLLMWSNLKESKMALSVRCMLILSWGYFTDFIKSNWKVTWNTVNFSHRRGHFFKFNNKDHSLFLLNILPNKQSRMVRRPANENINLVPRSYALRMNSSAFSSQYLIMATLFLS